MKNRLNLRSIAIAASFLLLAGTALADPIIYADSNATGDEWNRPIGDGPSISSLGPVEYHVQAFVTDLDDLYYILSLQTYDGYLHLYEGGFDPLDQLAGLIAANDDFERIGISLIDGIELFAGVTYYIVTSAFADGDEGFFLNGIGSYSGEATITLLDPQAVSVPEPGSLALLGLGLLAMGRMRRKARA